MAVNLRYQFTRLNIAEKLIVVNVALFIITRLVAVLFGTSVDALVHWFELPKDFGTFITQPWSIVTYAFFHGNLGHIFFNMIMLYFTGRIFMNLFGERKFINVYFLGDILDDIIASKSDRIQAIASLWGNQKLIYNILKKLLFAYIILVSILITKKVYQTDHLQHGLLKN